MSNVDTARLWCEEHLSRNGSLQRDGRTWLCSSPTREDRNPSLSVDIQKRVFKDHGTGDSGTLSQLADMLGVECPAWEPDESREEKNSPSRDGDAAKLWRIGRPATKDHPYVAAKGIEPFDLRVATDGRLMVPGYDAVTGAFRMVQTIAPKPDENGKWPKRDTGPAKCALWLVGNDKGAEDSSLAICEGPSTAAAVKTLCPEMAVVCSFGTANLPTVYEALRKRFPDREIVIASDSGTEELAAKCKGALAVIPSAAKGNYDWNDLCDELGSEEARRQFQQKLTAARQNTTSRKQSWNEKAGVLDGTGAKPIKRLFGLFPVGQVTLLAGMSGTGKSLLLQCLAQAGADGSGAFGQAEPVKTLFIEGDGDRNVFAGRAQAFAWEPKSGVQWLFTMEHGDSDFSTQTDEGRKTLDDILREVKPDLLVIDSISGVDGVLDELDTQMMKGAFKAYRDLASAHGVAVGAVHHLRKRPTQFIDRPVSLHDIAGSAAAQRLCHSIFGMWTESGEGTKQVITASLKDWGEAPEPFSYTIRTAESGCKELLFKFHGVEVHEEKDSKQGKVVDAIKSFGAEEFSREEVEERSGASGATVRRTLGKYADSKDLLRIAHGRETKYKRSPFSRVFCSLSSSTLFFEQKETRGQSQTESILLMGDEQYKLDEQHEQEPESYCSNGMSSIDCSSARPDVAFCSRLVHEQHDEQREQEKIPAPDEQPVETPKTDRVFTSRGASAPGPLVEVEEFPDPLPLPYEWRDHGWIIRVDATGNGERSFVIAKSRNGKPVCSLREPKRIAA